MRDAAVFTVGGWTVQPSLGRILRGGERVHLRPRTMDVLVYLAERPGKVVSREALIDAVWAREFVSDAALKTAIYELRQAFGDEFRRPWLIETIPKRGYRLVAEVAATQVTAVATAAAEAAPFRLVYGDREIALGEGETVIGRDPEAAIRIDSRAVSRRHARIVVSQGRAILEDLGSRNGTFVAGRRVEAAVELSDRDKVIVGTTALLFRVVGVPGTTETAGPSR